MAKNLSDGNCRCPFIGGEVVREIGGERRIERQPALIHKLQDHIGEYGFAERGRFENGVLVNRYWFLDAPDAVAYEMVEFGPSG